MYLLADINYYSSGMAIPFGFDIRKLLRRGYPSSLPWRNPKYIQGVIRIAEGRFQKVLGWQKPPNTPWHAPIHGVPQKIRKTG
jgi:hypothetical protein